MTQALTRLSSRLAALFFMIFGAARQQADHKILTRHMVQINKKQSSVEIISQVALCLKDILHYRLFAFVVKKEDGVDVWLDPKMYKDSIEDVILNDFNMEDRGEINYLNHMFRPDDHTETIALDDLVFYELKEENCCCRIYMLPAGGMSGYDDEAVNLILQGCSSALSRQLKIEHLKDAAVIDPLTRCYNRREFENQLKRTVADAARHKKPLSVFMFDLDHFKRVNDTYGHLGGDKVLVEIAKRVKDNMRTCDILARYGGEEFIAILPETDRQMAMELADRLRINIEKHPVVHEDHVIPVTASFGVAQMEAYSDMTKIIQDADTMLYKAKLNGRNQVMPGVIKIMSPEALNPELENWQEKTI